MSPLIQRRKKRVKRIRVFRQWHKAIGISLLAFFFVMALTGVLLGLKDVLGLKPSTAKAEVVSLNEWVSLKQINTAAIAFAKTKQLDTLIDRVDVRIDKGIAKVLFKRHFTELQLAGSTGEILSVRQRGDHFIERIHDGSIVEFYAQQTDAVKMIYSTLVGIGLLALSMSGYFLWAAPKKNPAKKD